MIKAQKDKLTFRNVKAVTSEGETVTLTFRKHPNQNEYLKCENYWIRNFAGTNVNPVDVNKFFRQEEVSYLVDNEVRNSNHRYPVLEPELFNRFKDVLIVGDGLGFDQHKLFKMARPNLCCITVNSAARFWQASLPIEFLIVNNPSSTAMNGLPIRNHPKLIANRKTHYPFIKNYKNIIYLYDSVADEEYQTSMSKNSDLHLDDYRNPICAAISLAHKYCKGNLYLAFCSSGYPEEKDGAIKVDENFYQYPAQKTADSIVDGNLFWYNFANRDSKIFHTGIKNTLKFSKYLDVNDFIESIL